jgi:hypothetical protein
MKEKAPMIEMFVMLGFIAAGFAATTIYMARLVLKLRASNRECVYRLYLVHGSLRLLQECERLIEESKYDVEHADASIRCSQAFEAALRTVTEVGHAVLQCAVDSPYYLLGARLEQTTQPLRAVLIQLNDAWKRSKADIAAAAEIRSLRERLWGLPEERLRYGDLATLRKDYEVALREFRALICSERSASPFDQDN